MSGWYTTRPISDRTRFRNNHQDSRFRATWSDTERLLGSELAQLDADSVVIEVDVPETAIRMDGGLYANAKAASPAVVVAFESKHGPLLYATDRLVAVPWGRGRMESWQHNVRAIAKTLESLRAVARYGVAESGEQYRGYRAIEGGEGGSSHLTRDQAFSVVQELAGVEQDEPLDAAVYRRAKSRAHPDRNDGDRKMWDLLEQAIEVLAS